MDFEEQVILSDDFDEYPDGMSFGHVLGALVDNKGCPHRRELFRLKHEEGQRCCKF